jgi:hypothetical protein
MGQASRGAEKSSRAKLDALWREIRRDTQQRWSISLRAAANIVGFCEFPVGWAWSEYRQNQFERTQLLDGRRWSNERGRSHDWLVIERHIRTYFETFGAPRFDEVICKHVLETIATTAPADSEPTVSTLRQLIAALRAEYENL